MSRDAMTNLNGLHDGGKILDYIPDYFSHSRLKPRWWGCQDVHISGGLACLGATAYARPLVSPAPIVIYHARHEKE